MRPAAPRLKWHQLRRRRSDPAFLRQNLEAGLAAAAAIEADLAATADGHFVCLHDLTLDRETTGSGPVATLPRAEVERLRQRGPDGSPLTSPPLFLDEIVAAARRHAAPPTGRIQLDIKEPGQRLTPGLLDRFAATLGDTAPAFTAGGCEWPVIQALAGAAPGLHAGFDPTDLYEHEPPGDAASFEALAARTLAVAPGLPIYYLEANLVLAGLAVDVNLVELIGAEVDAWTVDTDRPDLRPQLHALIAAGCRQITTNEPEALAPILDEVLACW